MITWSFFLLRRRLAHLRCAPMTDSPSPELWRVYLPGTPLQAALFRPAPSPSTLPALGASERVADLHSRLELACARLAVLGLEGRNVDTSAAASVVRSFCDAIADSAAARALAQLPEAVGRPQREWRVSEKWRKSHPVLASFPDKLLPKQHPSRVFSSAITDTLLVEVLRTEHVMQCLSAAAVRGPSSCRRAARSQACGGGDNALDRGRLSVLTTHLKTQAQQALQRLRGRRPRAYDSRTQLSAEPSVRDTATRNDDSAVKEIMEVLQRFRGLASRLADADCQAASAEKAALHSVVTQWRSFTACGENSPGNDNVATTRLASPWSRFLLSDPAEFLCQWLLCSDSGVTGQAADDDVLAACLWAAAARDAREQSAAGNTREDSGETFAQSSSMAKSDCDAFQDGCMSGLVLSAFDGEESVITGNKWQGLGTEVGRLVLLWWAGWAAADEVRQARD